MKHRFFAATMFILVSSAAVVLAAGSHPTCGQMTAKFATQPAAIADLAAAWADYLGAHADVVGQTDPVTSKSEVDGLRSIVKHFRTASEELSAAASEMRAAAAWQDTKHDVAKMRADAKITEARDHKIKALNESAAELQKEIEFWKSIPVAQPK